jgi:EAL domain-containing protein (putative c-di-GMP-specific phosphodiesterase class I)
MEDADAEAAISVAERLLAALAVPFSLGGTEARLTASVGISRSDPETMSEAEVVRNADVAMYHAKAAGKDRYELFRPEMHEAVVKRVALLAELHTAIDENQFELHYQPLIDLADRRILGFEALVRWRHPVRGLVPPVEFIPLAEESGLIIPLGRWVLEEAVHQLRAWDPVAGAAQPLCMSVNVAARQLQSPDLVAAVAEALGQSGVAPGRLTLELTEGTLLEDVHATVARLYELKGLGVKLAIDDFGTGFSSLSYLRRFPVDTLKVDKSFVDDIHTARGEELIRTMLELGHHLGLATVAEGIESPDQEASLAALGCQIGQGYLFSRPLPAAAVPSLFPARTPPTADPTPCP